MLHPSQYQRQRMSSQPATAWYRDARRLRTAGIELSITTLFLVAYFVVRGMRPESIEDSVSRSLAIVHFEQQIGIFAEVRWQNFFIQHDSMMSLANLIYAWGHYPVMAVIAVWLVLKDPRRFRFTRNVLVVSAVMGVVAYWVLPTAPPRLLEVHGYDFGFVDTVHSAASNANYFQPGPLVNDYAAVPSFHFGWIALMSAAIWVNTRRRSIRTAAVLMSAAMWWAVTVTANHYFFDMIMGGVVVGVSWLLVAWLQQVNWRALPARVRATVSRERAPVG